MFVSFCFCTTLASIAATDHCYDVTHCVIVNGYAIDVICDSGAEISVLSKHAVPNLLIMPTKLLLCVPGATLISQF